MITSRRIRVTLATAALCATMLAPTIAQAQSWPSRPVTMIVPFPAGGSSDLLARTAAKELTDKLGQQFIVDNRGGASGNAGAQAAAKAAPDGYTILFSTPGPILLNTLMSKNLQYDPERDFKLIIAISNRRSSSSPPRPRPRKPSKP